MISLGMYLLVFGIAFAVCSCIWNTIKWPYNIVAAVESLFDPKIKWYEGLWAIVINLITPITYLINGFRGGAAYAKCNVELENDRKDIRKLKFEIERDSARYAETIPLERKRGYIDRRRYESHFGEKFRCRYTAVQVQELKDLKQEAMEMAFHTDVPSPSL